MVYLQATRDNQWNLVWPDGQVQKFSTLRFANDFIKKMGAVALILNTNGERMN